MLTLNILQIISLVEKDGNAANACIMGGYSHDANVPDPELAILLMNMLANFRASSVSDQSMRPVFHGEFLSLLQQRGVLILLSCALRHCRNKNSIKNSLMLIYQILCTSRNQRIDLLTMVDGLHSFNQRVDEADNAKTFKLRDLETTATAAKKMLEQNHSAIQEQHDKELELAQKHERDIASVRAQSQSQLEQAEIKFFEIKNVLEKQLNNTKSQNEQLQVMLSNQSESLGHAEQQSAQQRMSGLAHEEELGDARRKVRVLEIRLEEVAESSSIANKQLVVCKKELAQLRSDHESLTITAGEKELLCISQGESIQNLESQVEDQACRLEETYQKLILLAKAHQSKSQDFEAIQDKLNRVERENAELITQQDTLQEQFEECKIMMAAKDDQVLKMSWMFSFLCGISR